MRRWHSLIDLTGRVSARLAAVLMYVLLAQILAEIVFSGVFRIELSFNYELSTYNLAAIATLGMSQALASNIHIRVTVVQRVLPRRLGWQLEIVATAASVVIAVYLAFSMAALAYRSWLSNVQSFYPSETPLAVPQTLLAIALGLFALSVVSRLGQLVANPSMFSHESGMGE